MAGSIPDSTGGVLRVALQNTPNEHAGIVELREKPRERLDLRNAHLSCLMRIHLAGKASQQSRRLWNIHRHHFSQ